MLAIALRAVVLLVVVGWYSTGVWKMIDSYFKDRFDKYLHEEYAKNPRIKKDIDAHRAKTNERSSSVKIISDIPQHDINTQNFDHSIENDIKYSERFNNEGETTEHNGKNMQTFKNIKKNQHFTIEPKSSSSINRKSHEVSSIKDVSRRKKKKLKTITISNRDFEAMKLKASTDYDFSEFEYEDDNGQLREKVQGVSVGDLPFKPKADLGHLDIISEDEYCPLNMDYHEKNCKDTKKWP